MDRIDLKDLAGAGGLRCACISGFSVRTNVCILAHDRMWTERLCRYAGRAPVVLRQILVRIENIDVFNTDGVVAKDRLIPLRMGD